MASETANDDGTMDDEEIDVPAAETAIGTIRAVKRCQDATLSLDLDLSECTLIEIPEKIFYLMRHTQLVRCNLSRNVITKIPAIFAFKFTQITELNLYKNRLTKLPDELGLLNRLRIVNIARNSFETLPKALTKLNCIANIIAFKNHIAEIDVEAVRTRTSLQELDLRDNPLTPGTRKALTTLPKRLTLRVTGSAPTEEQYDETQAQLQETQINNNT